LLSWKILIDGASPFRHLLDLEREAQSLDDIKEVIQELKMSNAVGDMIERDLEGKFVPALLTFLKASLNPDPQQRELPDDHVLSTRNFHFDSQDRYVLYSPASPELATDVPCSSVAAEAKVETHKYDLQPRRDAVAASAIPDTYLNLVCSYQQQLTIRGI
jgi:hypothetical protein